jgi:flavin reductase (DIM6/NTAB) family NADH-FMN oxidoreductase RutF
MEKTQIALESICYPMPCALVGAVVGEKPNFLAVAWLSMVNFKPPYIAIALGKIHYTNPGIRQNRAFSVNIPSQEMLEVTDYCGIVSGRKADKAALFNIFYGSLKGAPMITECPYNLECRLVETVDLPSNELFIGEIIAAYSDDRYLTKGIPDMRKIRPMILSMPDTTYLEVGDPIGRAWNAGKRLIKTKK